MVNITATSSSQQHQPSKARFDSLRCWKPSTDSDPNDYLQVDLGRIKVLTGVVTKEATVLVFVETYKIQYSIDSVDWKYYPNFDGTPKVFYIDFSCYSCDQAFPGSRATCARGIHFSDF